MSKTINSHITNEKNENMANSSENNSKVQNPDKNTLNNEQKVQDLKNQDTQTNENSPFKDMNFLDIVDDYLTGFNLLDDNQKAEYQKHIKETLNSGDILTNVKLYDELMTRYEENKCVSGDQFVSNTAFAMACFAENAINKKIENLNENERHDLMKDFRAKISFGQGRVEGLKMQEPTSQRDREIKSTEHRLACYSKFANELVNQKERE